MGEAGVAFAVVMIGSVFLICYLGHRFERQVGWLLDRWWGLPLMLMGWPVLAFAAAFGAAELVRKALA